MTMVSFLKTEDYSEWYDEQTAKVRAQIDSRLQKISEFDHYVHVKKLTTVLFEIKFNNGNRIYCTETVVDGKTVILILGGNKNGQDKDIKRAQKIAEKIHSS